MEATATTESDSRSLTFEKQDYLLPLISCKLLPLISCKLR